MAIVAVMGAGLLGTGFVENLLTKGHTVRVWNRTAEKLAPLVAKGAVAAASPAEAVSGAERVHLILAEDSAVDAVIDALRPGLGAGVPIVDHSTNLPEKVAARFVYLGREGVTYLHAPVFMSPANARDAMGLMMIAGPKDVVDAVSPALATMTGKLWHVGERPDKAAVFKLAGNAVLVGLTGVMGDVLAIGAGRGMEPSEILALFDVFKPGTMVGFFGQRIAKAGEGPASFELSMARKDVRLMMECAGEPTALTVLPALASAMDQAIEAGKGQQDFAVFARKVK